MMLAQFQGFFLSVSLARSLPWEGKACNIVLFTLLKQTNCQGKAATVLIYSGGKTFWPCGILCWLQVVLYSLRCRRPYLTLVSIVCKTAPISLFLASNGLNKLLEMRFESVPFSLIGNSTMALVAGQLWCSLKSCSGARAQNKDFGAVSH